MGTQPSRSMRKHVLAQMRKDLVGPLATSNSPESRASAGSREFRSARVTPGLTPENENLGLSTARNLHIENAATDTGKLDVRFGKEGNSWSAARGTDLPRAVVGIHRRVCPATSDRVQQHCDRRFSGGSAWLRASILDARRTRSMSLCSARERVNTQMPSPRTRNRLIGAVQVLGHGFVAARRSATVTISVMGSSGDSSRPSPT